MESSAKFRTGKAILGALLLAIAAFIAIETLLLADPTQQATIGPKFFPVLIMIGLAINGVVLLIEAAQRDDGEEWLELDMKPVGLILIALIVQMTILETAGWIIATGLMFAMVARAFGSRRVVVDLALGLLVAALSFYLFNEGLGLSLPGGFIMDYFDLA